VDLFDSIGSEIEIDVRDFNVKWRIVRFCCYCFNGGNAIDGRELTFSSAVIDKRRPVVWGKVCD
jgi:hypothetical protein